MGSLGLGAAITTSVVLSSWAVPSRLGVPSYWPWLLGAAVVSDRAPRSEPSPGIEPLFRCLPPRCQSLRSQRPLRRARALLDMGAGPVHRVLWLCDRHESVAPAREPGGRCRDCSDAVADRAHGPVRHHRAGRGDRGRHQWNGRPRSLEPQRCAHRATRSPGGDRSLVDLLRPGLTPFAGVPPHPDLALPPFRCCW